MSTIKKEKLHVCKGNHETAKCQKLLKYKERLSSKHRKSGNMIKTANNIGCVTLSTKQQKHKTATKHLTRNAEYLKYGLTLSIWIVTSNHSQCRKICLYVQCLSMFQTCSSNVTTASQNWQGQGTKKCCLETALMSKLPTTTGIVSRKSHSFLPRNAYA